MLLLGASLRSVYYGLDQGLDTHSYYVLFHNNLNFSFQDILQRAFLRYSGQSGEESDVGYVLLCKIIGLFSDDFHIYTFFALLLFFVPFGIFLNRHFNNIASLAFAFVFYVALINIYAMGGGRQMFALGMAIASFLFYEKRKYKSFFIAFFIGVTLHFSMIVFAIPFLLERFSPNKLKKLHLLAFLFFPIVLLMPNIIILFMARLFGYSKYEAYGMNAEAGGTETFIFLIEAMSLYCLYSIKSFNISAKISKVLYAMLPCLTIFAPLIYSNGTMIRISLYFFIYMTVLIPEATKEYFSPGLYKVVLGGLTAVLIFLTLKGNNIPYDFYWNVDPVNLQ